MATFNGTIGNDTLTGTATADLLNGFDGNDSLNGGDGNDTMYGGNGNDTLNGGLGADSMSGGAGNDRYKVDNVGDLVIEYANEGTDWVDTSISFSIATLTNVENILLTGLGNINATGNGLNNSLWGNEGSNVLDGGLGADTLLGGDGDDTYIVDNVGDAVLDGTGHDTVKSNISYTLTSGIENLVLLGTGNNYGVGNELDNLILGTSGHNILNGDLGADNMLGGAGDDLYIVDNVDDVVWENASAGLDTVSSSVSYGLGTSGGVEELYLQGNAGYALGNALNNRLVGNNLGNILNGETGADTMQGGLGDDLYIVDNVGDVVIESASAGTDSISSLVSFNLNNAANVENLTLQGSGNEYGTGNGLNNAIAGNTGGNIFDGQGGNDTLSGSSGADLYLAAGTFGADTIVETTSTTDIDKVWFQNATYNELWFKQIGNNLEISQVGTSNKVTVQNWYSGAANQIDVTHDAGLAHQLQANKVQGLVTAMSGFSPQNLSGNATLIAARDAAWTV